MKLELKHIAPYLPYGLNGIRMDNKYQLVGFISRDHVASGQILPEWAYLGDKPYMSNVSDCQPILRPLSDLLKMCKDEPLFNDWVDCLEGVTDWDMIQSFIYSDDRLSLYYPYTFWNKMFELHFDVFGLIEKGLAIDINTL